MRRLTSLPKQQRTVIVILALATTLVVVAIAQLLVSTLRERQLLRSLSGDDPNERKHAARSLYELDPRRAEKHFERLFRSEHKWRFSPDYSFDGIGGAIVEIGKPVVPLLARLAKDPDTTVRRHALDALGEIGADAVGSLPVIESATTDRVPSVRSMAASALGSVYSGTSVDETLAREAIVILVGMLHDDSNTVATAAVCALAQFPSYCTSILPPLRSLRTSLDQNENADVTLLTTLLAAIAELEAECSPD